MSDDTSNDWSASADTSSDGMAPGNGETSTEQVGFFQRLMQSLAGILIGLVLTGATIYGLFWNEGRAIGTTRALNEGATVAVTVPASRIDPANEGRLIHLSGQLAAAAPLADREFRVETRAVRLVRRVEMYQWKEDQKTESRSNVGGSQTRTTTTSYERVWSDRPIDSSRFRQRDGHANPAMPVAGRTETATDARIGQFRADQQVIGLFGRSAEQKLGLGAEALAPFAARFGTRARLVDGAVYIGEDPQAPRIGDLRISYSVLPEGPVSLAGRQTGEGLSAYVARNGREVFLGETGTKAADVLFAHAHETNSLITWILRGVAFLAMWIGWFLVLRPFVVLADIIPILGSAMAAGAGLVALALTLAVYLPAIAIAWFWHRPVMSILLIAAGFAGFLALRVIGQRRRAAAGPMSVAPAGREWPAYPQSGQPAPMPQSAAYPQAAPGAAAPASFLNIPASLGGRGGGQG